MFQWCDTSWSVDVENVDNVACVAVRVVPALPRELDGRVLVPLFGCPTEERKKKGNRSKFSLAACPCFGATSSTPKECSATPSWSLIAEKVDAVARRVHESVCL